jgi:flagellar motor switch protein FliM
MNTELPPMPQPQAMTQEEVERLLVAAEAQQAMTESLGTGLTGPAQRHEFPQISSFSPAEMRIIKSRYEEFIRAVGGRLSGHLRTECGLQMTKLETSRFQALMDKLPNPTHLTLFRLDPPGSVCLLEIPPKLALNLVDRELGGPGIFPDEPRDLTRIETRLISRVIDIFTSEWCGVWRDAVECRPVVLRYETCGQYVKVHGPGAMLLTLGMELRIGDMVEQLQLVVPHPVLEALMHKLNADAEAGDKNKTAKPPAATPWNPGLNQIEMRISAEWSGMEMTAGQLGEIKPGDILPVPATTAGKAQILVDSVPKFVGDLGKCGPQWAVKITGKHGG